VSLEGLANSTRSVRPFHLLRLSLLAPAGWVVVLLCSFLELTPEGGGCRRTDEGLCVGMHLNKGEHGV